MKMPFRKNFYIIFMMDILLLISGYYMATWLRYEGQLPPDVMNLFLYTTAPLVVLNIFSFFIFDLYHGMWRYTGIKDLMNVIKCSLLGALLFTVYIAVVYRFNNFSRAIILIDFLLNIVTIGGIRLFVRMYYQNEPEFFENFIFRRKIDKTRKRVIILGAWEVGENLLRALNNNPEQPYNVEGFVDESPLYKGMKIHGVPILGSISDLPQLINYYSIDYIFIAASSIRSEKLKMLVEKCTGLGIKFKVIPSVNDWLNDNVKIPLRDINVEDLLKRDPVHLDMDEVRQNLQGKSVLVTGAGGSIGSELARQILEFKPEKLILLDNAETPLFDINNELAKKAEGVTVIACIGDIRTSKSLDRIFKMHKPNYVYHAAAYKHVPLMEITPDEAAKNNIIGTFKLATIASNHNVEKFVMISTDKAVKPSSVMGATKRIAEMVVHAMNGYGTCFTVVRFGNVLASNGSVVPTFEKQISNGGPVTVTHPDVTRYFMTITEAAMLVLQAGAISKGGELFLLDMGEPIKIVDLAKSMIRLAGLVPEKDIEIVYTGLRPGEKLHEELLISGEDVLSTAHERIKICKHKNDFNKKKIIEQMDILNRLIENETDPNAALNIIKVLVPAYAIQSGLSEKNFKDNVVELNTARKNY
jgi:FlaA1/EpsC-like NDP-sugar epimerase